jgi:hypothetical protein
MLHTAFAAYGAIVPPNEPVAAAGMGRGSVLTYHGDQSRWQQVKDGVMLTAVSRGQEFILDCGDYPEAINWLAELLPDRCGPGEKGEGVTAIVA